MLLDIRSRCGCCESDSVSIQKTLQEGRTWMTPEFDDTICYLNVFVPCTSPAPPACQRV
jgi:hypothetical protein